MKPRQPLEVFLHTNSTLCNTPMTIQKLFIGSIGTIRVELPILQVGSGTPRGLITAVQHGGELSPLWIIDQLVKSPPMKGTLTIVPVANPFGFIFGERNEVIEGKDPNRQFPGKPTGDFSARIANAIFTLAQESDFVIDLHTFSRQSPFLVGYAQDDRADGASVEKMIQLLSPDVVWTVDDKKGEDRRFVGSFDGALAKKGIPSVFIEMPNYQMISEQLISRITQSIRNVFEGYAVVPEKVLEIPRFQAKYLYADDAGIFDPCVQPLQTVYAGQEIGTLSCFPDFTKKKLTSPIGGTVLTIRGKDVLRTGSKLASIGI